MDYQIKGNVVPLLFAIFCVLLNGCSPFSPSEPTPTPMLPVFNSTQGTYFSAIQEAIDASLPGDVIIVSPGTYYENLDFKGKNITVRSTDPHNPLSTTIDGNSKGAVVSFRNGEGSTAVLEGFTIQNGRSKNGGGIYCVNSSPTISRNMILNNSADTGGGIYCSSASPRIEYNIIALNTAPLGGGGIYCGESSSPTIVENTIGNNSAQGSSGGGILCSDSTPSIASNDILWNDASEGGGIHCLNSTVTIVGNIFTKNKATEQGGGIYVSKFSVVQDSKGNPWPRLNTPPHAETHNSYSGNTHQGGLYSTGADVYFEPLVLPPPPPLPLR